MLRAACGGTTASAQPAASSLPRSTHDKPLACASSAHEIAISPGPVLHQFDSPGPVLPWAGLSALSNSCFAPCGLEFPAYHLSTRQLVVIGNRCWHRCEARWTGPATPALSRSAGGTGSFRARDRTGRLRAATRWECAGSALGVRQSVPGHSGVIGPTEPAGLVARCLLLQPVAAFVPHSVLPTRSGRTPDPPVSTESTVRNCP